jgi:signal transduction histidine kinase
MIGQTAGPTLSTTPSLLSIVNDCLRGAPSRVRQSAAIAVVAWIVLMIAQAFDSGSRPGAAALAEFLSALLASAGGVILGLAGLLQSSAEHRPTTPIGGDADGFRRVMLALPALALTAAALVAAAMGLMIARALLGTPVLFVALMTVVFGVMLWLAASTAMRAARTLYMHASAEAGAAATARADAVEAQVSALQARMNPHFLFNALNTVVALVRSDPATAERVTEQLSGVLRLTLERSARGMGTIAEEIAYVRQWLAVEQARLGERLRVEWDVDPSRLDVPLPPLVLQPLIENALHHGIGGRLEGGTIRIAVSGDATRVSLSVRDDGDGFPPVPVERTGLGNLRQRLMTIYGSRASVEIDRSSPGGAVTVTLPCRATDYGLRATGGYGSRATDLGPDRG